MSTAARIGVATVAIVLVVLTACQGASRPSTGTAEPEQSPSVAPPAAAFPPEGELAAGRHLVTIHGASFSFEVATTGWYSQPARTGGYIQRGADNATTPAWMLFWSLDNVYADPCAHTLLSPPVGPTAADLAAALLTIPGTDAIGPTDVTVGGLPGKHVVLTVRGDVGCEPEDFYLWDGPGESARYASQLPTTIRLWIIDVDGERIVIESELLQGGTSELDQEIDEIVESIRFE